MKVIVNKEKIPLSFDFEGKTYHFKVSKTPIKVSDELYSHLKELVPLAFDFAPENAKKIPVADVQVVDTVNKFTGAKFGMQSKTMEMRFKPEDKSYESDIKGPGWYGDGLQDDTP